MTVKVGSVLATLSVAASLVAYAQVPSCSHPAPPFPLSVIPYTGLTSGCSNAPGSPNCIAGEVIQFKMGDGVEATDCYIEWVWDFGNGHVFGDATMTHTFSSPGVYPVNLTLYVAGGSNQFSTIVPVISPSAIPAETPVTLAFLALTLVAIGLVSLRIVSSR